MPAPKPKPTPMTTPKSSNPTHIPAQPPTEPSSPPHTQVQKTEKKRTSKKRIKNNSGGHSQPSDPSTSPNLVAAEETQLAPKETEESKDAPEASEASEASEKQQATPEPTEGEHQAEPMDFTTENLNAPSSNINTPRQLTEGNSDSQESDGDTDSQGSDDDEPQQYAPFTQRISARVKQAMNYNLHALSRKSATRST
ncbi:hypothetical protein BGX27_001923 [Mortierella sp. AM989]|nr:hypothetical protein BGX27_001923 [Mortierella sp. AM989]